MAIDDVALTKSFEASVVRKSGGTSWADTPSEIEYHIKQGNEVHVLMSWGFGMVKISGNDVKSNIPMFDTTPNYRVGATADMGAWSFEINEMINDYGTTIYKSVYDYFKLPCDISFDDFNSRFGGFTRQQYLDLLKEKKAL